MSIKLIVGLGNPGPSYADTRHNAGVWLVSALAQLHNCAFKVENKFHAQVSEFKYDQQVCKLLLPLSCMNHSGKSVLAICQFYKIPSKETLIIHDDLDLPVGSIKLKQGGGHGGHNGLRDLIQKLGCQDFWRLRIGIGHPGPGNSDLVLNYVLGKPTKQDRQLIDEAIARGLLIISEVCKGQFNQAMNQLHTKR